LVLQFRHHELLLEELEQLLLLKCVIKLRPAFQHLFLLLDVQLLQLVLLHEGLQLLDQLFVVFVKDVFNFDGLLFLLGQGLLLVLEFFFINVVDVLQNYINEFGGRVHWLATVLIVAAV